MEAEGIATQTFRPGQTVQLFMAGGVTVEGQVDQMIRPAKPGDEPVCLVRVPIPLSELRRA